MKKYITTNFFEKSLRRERNLRFEDTEVGQYLQRERECRESEQQIQEKLISISNKGQANETL